MLFRVSGTITKADFVAEWLKVGVQLPSNYFFKVPSQAYCHISYLLKKITKSEKPTAVMPISAAPTAASLFFFIQLYLAKLKI
jgi:hypothetical protein